MALGRDHVKGDKEPRTGEPSEKNRIADGIADDLLITGQSGTKVDKDHDPGIMKQNLYAYFKDADRGTFL